MSPHFHSAIDMALVVWLAWLVVNNAVKAMAAWMVHSGSPGVQSVGAALGGLL